MSVTDDHAARVRAQARAAAGALADARMLPARRRHRLITRLGLFAVLSSAAVLSGVMYFETTALGPNRAALVTRFGELTRVVSAEGRVYRVPFLDRIVLVDLQPQPVPTMRLVSETADRHNVRIELRANWIVADPEPFWQAAAAKPADAARLIEAEIRTVVRRVAARHDAADLVSAEQRQALGLEFVEVSRTALERSGLRLQDLRVNSIQTIR